MKILILGLNFQPEMTGIGRYTGELASYLAAQGHAVRVITAPPYYPHWKIQGGYRAWRYRKETWQGVEIYRCPLWVPRRPKGLTRILHLSSFALSSMPFLAAQLSWKPELVLTIAPSLMNAPFALAFARAMRAKAWLHLQDFELDAAAGLKMLPGLSFLYPIARSIERYLLTRFDRVSTISENMRRRCIEKGVAPEGAFLLPNWVDTKKIYPLPRPSALRDELGIPAETFVALYHGAMGRKQGLELLLETARLLAFNPQILIVLCGQGPVREELVQKAASLPNVRFYDLQPEEKLNELVNLADVHLLPQLANAADLVLPSKLMTMLASGKPVVAAANPGTQIAQILEPIGVLVPPENASVLAESLVSLSYSPSQRQRMGELARSYACQCLDKEIILSRLQRSLTADDWIPAGLAPQYDEP